MSGGAHGSNTGRHPSTSCPLLWHRGWPHTGHCVHSMVSSGRTSMPLPVHWPHNHGNGPIWLDDLIPDLRQYDLLIWAKQIVMTCLHMWSYHVDVQEGLLDQFFHTLFRVSFESHFGVSNIVSRANAYRPGLAKMEWETKFPTHRVLETNWVLVLAFRLPRCLFCFGLYLC